MENKEKRSFRIATGILVYFLIGTIFFCVFNLPILLAAQGTSLGKIMQIFVADLLFWPIDLARVLLIAYYIYIVPGGL